jgi:SAM-dependent methyltransferase
MGSASRDRWARAAEGWQAQADAFGRDSMPVSAWMVDALAPQPGHAVLELAAGIGDTGLLAAELIRPGGTLISSDFAPEMLAAAQRRAQARGVTNVRFRQIDMNVPLDQPAASLDGVLGRWAYMLVDDGEAALRETRRILRHDGRVALAAWAGPDDNLWSAAPVRILQARGLLERDEPGGPGQFAWADPNAITDQMLAAGFVDPELEAIDFALRYPSIDDWWVAQTQMSTRTGDADRALDFATRSDVLGDLERAAEPFLQADDTLVIPARTWVAAATA